MRNPPFNNEQRLGFISVGHDPFKVARWGLALIFGGHKQGKSRLEHPTTGEKCCVGVLCFITPEMKREVKSSEHNVLGYEVVFTLPDGRYGSGWIDPVWMLGGDKAVFDDLENYNEYPDFASANDERDIPFRTIGLWLLGTVPALLINKLRGQHG